MESWQHTGYTQIGTGTAKTQLGGAGIDVVMPSWARGILAVRAQGIAKTPTAAESLLIKNNLESSDVPILPFEFPNEPVLSGLGATFATFCSSPKDWPVGVPVVGGNRIQAYSTALVANTVAPFCGINFLLSDGLPAFNQRKSKMGTATSAGTTASADVVGTAYQINGGTKLVELFGSVYTAAIAAADGLVGVIKFTSPDFVKSTPAVLQLNPVSAFLGVTGVSYVDGVSRQNVNIPINQICTLTDTFNASVITAAAGKFVSGVVYESGSPVGGVVGGPAGAISLGVGR